MKFPVRFRMTEKARQSGLLRRFWSRDEAGTILREAQGDRWYAHFDGCKNPITIAKCFIEPIEGTIGEPLDMRGLIKGGEAA